MKRILSLVLCALMVIAIVPMTVFAEEAPVAIFALGANSSSAAHKDNNSAKTTYTETVDGYTLSITGGNKMYPGSYDAKGNSALKLGSSSAVGGFSFTVPEDVTSVAIYAAKYKANTTKLSVNGTTYTLTGASNNGEYDKIEVDTSATKTVTVTTVSGGVRCMINTIEFYAASGETDEGEGETPIYTVTVVSEGTTVDTAEVEKGASYTLPAATEKDGYSFEGWSNGAATYPAGTEVTINANTTFTAVFKKIINFPKADSTLTIAEAIALGKEIEESNTYSEDKYYVTGVITEVYNTSYGNMYIADEEGNTFTVYGTYSADGSTSYSALAVKPVAGDTVTVYGIIGQYNGTPQMKNGWITEHVAAEPTPDPEPEPEPDPTPDPEPDPDPTPDVPTGDKPAASFDFGENKEDVTDDAEDHKDGTEVKADKTYTDGNYTLTITNLSKIYDGGNDEAGVGALKLGTGSVVGTFTFAVPEDVVKVVIHVAMYKAKATIITINGEEYEITTSSNDGAYTAIEIDTSVTKSITVATVTGKTRCMIDKIDFYTAAPKAPTTEEVKTAVWVDGYQKSAVENGVYNVRFAIVINGFFAGQDFVGVDITTTAGGGKSWDDLKTNTVYRSITANFGTEAVTAAERGGEYITAAAITGVPTSVGPVEFVVTPYVIVGGAKVYGEAVTVTVTP